jgi:hypothetical protein
VQRGHIDVFHFGTHQATASTGIADIKVRVYSFHAINRDVPKSTVQFDLALAIMPSAGSNA